MAGCVKILLSLSLSPADFMSGINYLISLMADNVELISCTIKVSQWPSSANRVGKI